MSRLQARLEAYIPRNSEDKTPLVLRALVDHAPTTQGHSNITADIVNCLDDDQLRQLADKYISGLLIPMCAQGSKTPAISEHPSRPSAEINAESIEDLVDTAKGDLSSMKNLALRRDKFRCVLTGKVDSLFVLAGHVNVFSRHSATTVLAHIIPYSLTPKSDRPAEIKKASTVFEILSRFSGYDILPEVNGNNINRIENVFTISQESHNWFGRLDIWLEAIEGRENTYRLRKAHIFPDELTDSDEVILSSTDQRLHVPNPRFLAIHAACAKVCRTRGMPEVIDKIMRDLENVKVLSEDASGSSFDLLRGALEVLAF